MDLTELARENMRESGFMPREIRVAKMTSLSSLKVIIKVDAFSIPASLRTSSSVPLKKE